jgi:hypothetical protein
MSAVPTNRKPADRLAEVREQLVVLKAVEQSLRAGLISGALALEGDDYVVVVEKKQDQRLDLVAMRQHVPESIWSPYLITTTTNYVKTRRKASR